jgi:hypothetical protein
LKLHNYREGLAGLFKLLDTEPIRFLKTNIIRRKFSYLIKLLKRPNYYGINSKNIMNYAIADDVGIFAETWDELISNLEDVFRLIIAYEERKNKMMVFHGPITQINANESQGTQTTIITGDNNKVKQEQTILTNGAHDDDIKDFILAFKNDKLSSLVPPEELQKLDEIEKEENPQERQNLFKKLIDSGTKLAIAVTGFVNANPVVWEGIRRFIFKV